MLVAHSSAVRTTWRARRDKSSNAELPQPSKSLLPPSKPPTAAAAAAPALSKTKSKSKSPTISAAAEKLASEAEQRLLAGDGPGCTTMAMKALQLGPSPLAHVLVARSLLSNDKPEEGVKHYDLAFELDPSSWDLRIEAVEALVSDDQFAGAGLSPELAARAVRYAREACELVEEDRLKHGRSDPLRGARALSYELRARGLLGRLLRVQRDDAGAARAMSQADALSQRYCNPAMAFLPRLGKAGSAISGDQRAAKLKLHGRTVQLERLSKYPALFRVRGLLSKQECKHVIACAKPRLDQSGVAMQGGGQTQNFRTSSTAWVSATDDPLLRTLSERVAALMGLPSSGLLTGQAADSGKVQVVAYGPGQQYGTHHDCNGLIRRYATCLYYLNEVEEGGETSFPVRPLLSIAALDPEGTSGLMLG